tara:strand:- start:909 stop:1010 length:102 start_codon:yes stop_codon:yes gene_type:complete
MQTLASRKVINPVFKPGFLLSTFEKFFEKVKTA